MEQGSDAGAAFDFLVEPLEAVGRPELSAMRRRMAQAATHFADRVIPPAPQPGMCGLPLEADGFRIAGPPGGISERAGDHLRFEIIAVPLQEKPH